LKSRKAACLNGAIIPKNKWSRAEHGAEQSWVESRARCLKQQEFDLILQISKFQKRKKLLSFEINYFVSFKLDVFKLIRTKLEQTSKFSIEAKLIAKYFKAWLKRPKQTRIVLQLYVLCTMFSLNGFILVFLHYSFLQLITQHNLFSEKALIIISVFICDQKYMPLSGKYPKKYPKKNPSIS